MDVGVPSAGDPGAGCEVAPSAKSVLGEVALGRSRWCEGVVASAPEGTGGHPRWAWHGGGWQERPQRVRSSSM